jgi:uncharacterized protein YbjT (DUF2867 family)
MRVLVVGATGGSGRAAVEALLAAGHEVTAFARRPQQLAPHERLRAVSGDALQPGDVRRAVEGQDAVVVTLGISESPLRVRLKGPAHTPLDVRSRGTRHVIDAMGAQGVRRLVVQTSYGVGETRERLGLSDRLVFALLLRPQIDDTERHEEAVRGSRLDWVLAQPVHLTDAPTDGLPSVALDGTVRERTVSRRSVGRFLAEAVREPRYVGRTVSLSGAA